MTKLQNIPPKISVEKSPNTNDELLASTILEVQQTLYKMVQAQIPNPDPVATKVANFNSLLVTSGAQLVLEYNRLEKAGHCKPFIAALVKTVVNGAIYGALGQAELLPVYTIDACMEALIGKQVYQQSIQKIESMRDDVTDDLARKRQPDESIWSYVWRIKNSSDRFESLSDSLAIPTVRKLVSELNQKIEERFDTSNENSNQEMRSSQANTSSHKRSDGTGLKDEDKKEAISPDPIPSTGTYREFHPDPNNLFQLHPIIQVAKQVDVKVQGGSGKGIGVEVGLPLLGSAADAAAIAAGVPVWPITLVIAAAVFTGILIRKKDIKKETKKLNEKYEYNDQEFKALVSQSEAINGKMEAFKNNPNLEDVKKLIEELKNGQFAAKKAAAKADERQGEIKERYRHLGEKIQEQAIKDFEAYKRANEALEHAFDEYKIYFEGIELLMDNKEQDCLNHIDRVLLTDKKSFKNRSLMDSLRESANNLASAKKQLQDTMLLSEFQDALQQRDWNKANDLISKIKNDTLREKLKETFKKDIEASIAQAELSQDVPHIQLASYSSEKQCFFPAPDASLKLGTSYYDILIDTENQHELSTLGSQIQAELQLKPNDYELRLSYALWLYKTGYYVYAFKAAKSLNKQNSSDSRVRTIEGAALYKLGLETGLQILQETRQFVQNDRLANMILLDHFRNKLQSKECSIPDEIAQLDRTGIFSPNARELYQVLDDPEKMRSILNERNVAMHEIRALEKDLGLLTPLDNDEHAPMDRSEPMVHKSEEIKAACVRKKQEMGSRFGVFYAETAELIFWAFCQATHITANYSIYGQQVKQYLKDDAQTLPNDILSIIHLYYMTELETLLATEISRTKQALTTVQFSNLILKLLNSLVYENPRFEKHFSKKHKENWKLFHKSAEWVLPLAIQSLSLWLRNDSPMNAIIQGSPGIIIHIPGIDWLLKAGPNDALGLSRFFLHRFLVRCNTDRLLNTKDFLAARGKTLISWSQYLYLDKIFLPLTNVWGVGYTLENTGYALQYVDAYALKYTYVTGVTLYYLWEDWRMHSLAIMENNPLAIKRNNYWLNAFIQYGKKYHASSYTEILLYLRALMISRNSLENESDQVNATTILEEESVHMLRIMLETLNTYEKINNSQSQGAQAQKKLYDLKKNIKQLGTRYEKQPGKLNFDFLYTAVLLGIWHMLDQNSSDLESTKEMVLQTLLSSFDTLERNYGSILSKTQFCKIFEEIKNDFKVRHEDRRAIERLNKNFDKIARELSIRLKSDKDYAQIFQVGDASDDSDIKKLTSLASMLLFYPSTFKRVFHSTKDCSTNKPHTTTPYPVMSHKPHLLRKMSVFNLKTPFSPVLMMGYKKYLFTKHIGLFCLGSSIFSYWVMHKMYDASAELASSIKQSHYSESSVQIKPR